VIAYGGTAIFTRYCDKQRGKAGSWRFAQRQQGFEDAGDPLACGSARGHHQSGTPRQFPMFRQGADTSHVRTERQQERIDDFGAMRGNVTVSDVVTDL